MKLQLISAIVFTLGLTVLVFITLVWVTRKRNEYKKRGYHPKDYTLKVCFWDVTCDRLWLGVTLMTLTAFTIFLWWGYMTIK